MTKKLEEALDQIRAASHGLERANAAIYRVLERTVSKPATAEPAPAQVLAVSAEKLAGVVNRLCGV